ncbi:DUF4142 domain-containing protein [Dyella sp. 2HG41-7]|uniref:DUF4142 domain-containing protein n=1 Tax=Dyella sp. 2HG41-7 TaxID=2883239 RepID=UPI001F2D53FE|nr:DUF4142 domain-containing protein [Dyella sp. 2HG41-7]
MRGGSFSRLVPMSLVLMWLLLVSGLVQAADANQPPANDEQAFLARARSDNASQIAMAKLALSKSTNPRVIDLANSIIQERTALETRLAQLTPGHDEGANQPAAATSMLARMQALSGDAFDKTFASASVKSHCRIISAYEAMKLSSSDVALRDLAHDAIPALRGNLTVALSVLRSSDWTPSRHQEALTAVDSHAAKAPVFWEPISLVAAPW